jgi:hypothetical protein
MRIKNTRKKKSPNRGVKGALLKSWWVVLFAILCIGWYLHAVSSRNDALDILGLRLKNLEEQKQLALQQREDLELALRSQTDPTWIEMMLMKELGMVPEGWLKVFFVK